MRRDLPNNIPHDLRVPPDLRPEPLDPSPLERHAGALQNTAEHLRQVTRPEIQRITTPKLPSNSRDVPTDHRIRRDRIPQQAIGLSLRDEEVKLLSVVGRFRVTSLKAISQTIYNKRDPCMERDLAFLRDKGLVEVNTVLARTDGRRVLHREAIKVVTLTEAGKQVARQTSGVSNDQQLYAGMVKYREVEHDSEIYPAYLKQAEAIERKGGTNLRVRLDFELKSQVQKAIYAERKAAPDRDLNEIKQQVAERFDLPFVESRIQIPDARIEYDLDQGSRASHDDIEVVTAAYHRGHLRGKAQTKFHLYAASADRATLTAKIEHDHDLLGPILEL
jgi:hypothetical protein